VSALSRTFAQVPLYVFASYLNKGVAIGVKNAPMQKCGAIGAVLKGATLARCRQRGEGYLHIRQIGLGFDERKSLSRTVTSVAGKGRPYSGLCLISNRQNND